MWGFSFFYIAGMVDFSNGKPSNGKYPNWRYAKNTM